MGKEGIDWQIYKSLTILCCRYHTHTHLANVIHVMSSLSTRPEDMSNSANCSNSMPSSSCLLNWMPAAVNMSMESCAYMSSLERKEKRTCVGVQEKNLYHECNILALGHPYCSLGTRLRVESIVKYQLVYQALLTCICSYVGEARKEYSQKSLCAMALILAFHSLPERDLLIEITAEGCY